MKKEFYFSVICSVLIIAVYCFFAVPFGRNEEEIVIPLEDVVFEVESEPVILEDVEDLILASYLNEELREEVLVFFEKITGSREVAEVILSNAATYNIPPALAFSLCAEESEYKPRAINTSNKNETIDRGLFQLNSASFPHLTIDDFYNPRENAKYGLSHLRWCMDVAGTEVSGLAMYNAGVTRVRSMGTPKRTLDYVSRILKRQRKIEELFAAEYLCIAEAKIIEVELPNEEEKTTFRISLLTPLGGR